MSDFFKFTSEVAFANPAWLWALFIPFVLFVVLLAKKCNFFASLMRTIALGLLLLALSKPYTKEREIFSTLPVLVDVSESMPRKSFDVLATTLKELFHRQDRPILSIYPFGGRPGVPFQVTKKPDLKTLSNKLNKSKNNADSENTNIEFALQKWQNSFGTLLFFSDGLENVSHARNVLNHGVNPSIYPLLPDSQLFWSGSVRIASTYSPLIVDAGQNAEIRTALENGTDSSFSGTLTLSKLSQENKEEILYKRDVNLDTKNSSLFIDDVKNIREGVQRFTATLKDSSGKVISQKYSWITGRRKNTILLLSGNQTDSRVIKKLLEYQGFTIKSLTAKNIDSLKKDIYTYSAIIFNNIAKKQLPSFLLPALPKFVRSGKGLVLIGGKRSFGLGGYRKTTLEKLSPVSFLPPLTKKRRLLVAIELVLDKSRSMNTNNKIHSARRAALTSINALKSGDFVGVIGFDTSPFELIPLQNVKSAKKIARQRINNLTPAGKTNLLPALAMARNRLERSTAGRKHIIVLSDGKFPDAGSVYVQEAKRLNNAGITLSTVALGVEADVPFMQTLAKYGNGSFYHTLDASRLPEIFVNDIKVSTGEKTIREQSNFEVLPGPSHGISIPHKELPKLKGFVHTVIKKNANLELITKKENKAFPILSSWKVGKGKVIAFSSDANGRWSSPWLRWKNFAIFWKSVIESVIKGSPDSSQIDFSLTSKLQGKKLEIEVAIYDDGKSNFRGKLLSGKLESKAGDLIDLEFEQLKPGLFKTKTNTQKAGDFLISLSYKGINLPTAGISIAADELGEIPGQGINASLLGDIARLSGGHINPDLKTISTKTSTKSKKTTYEICLLLLTALIILLEAFVRERT